MEYIIEDTKRRREMLKNIKEPHLPQNEKEEAEVDQAVEGWEFSR